MKVASKQITVIASPTYLPELSAPERRVFTWDYHIEIINNTNEPIELLDRYWKITDGRGKINEVRSPGVLGLKPTIKPQGTFSYSSYCKLPTDMGSMTGLYRTKDHQNKVHYIPIPEMILHNQQANTVVELDIFKKQLH